jgi:type II secretory pathway component PulC
VKPVRLLEAALFALCCALGIGLARQLDAVRQLETRHQVDARQFEARHQVDEGSGGRGVIVERNLFRVSTLLPAAPVVTEAVPEVEELAATRLPLRLLGTAGPLAAIEDQHARKQRVVRAGDALGGAATVVRIERRRIVIQNGATREELALDDAAELARTPTSTSTAAPLAMQATPRLEQGQVTGVRLSAIERGSVFDEIGIREGDTVTQVNGVVATNQQDSEAVLRELTEASELAVNVVGADGVARTLSRSLGN